MLRSACPIAAALDVVGDRWTLLILRDLFLGKTKYNELASAEEGIPTNVLAERLQRLQKFGLIEKETYQQHPVRYTYSLTEKGRELRHAMAALALWSKQHVPGVNINPALRTTLTASR
jgi:DNA-binding HxlR family transcriptional regulator